jgi:hypothetical protein
MYINGANTNCNTLRSLASKTFISLKLDSYILGIQESCLFIMFTIGATTLLKKEKTLPSRDGNGTPESVSFVDVL